MIIESHATYAGFHTRVLSVAGAGTPLVLIHGIGDSADTWRGVMAELETAGRAAVAIDLPGSGEADELRPGDILPQHDAFIDALVAELGAVVLVGNSLGAIAAVRATSRGSTDIAAVVTIAEPALADDWKSALIRKHGHLIPVRLLERLNVPKRVYAWIVEQGVRRFVFGGRPLPDPNIIVLQLERYPNIRAWVQLLSQMLSIATETVAGYVTDSIAKPALIIHGLKDRMITVHASERLHELLPASELVVMPESGHCPQIDDPVGLTRLLIKFVDAKVSEPQTEAG